MRNWDRNQLEVGQLALPLVLATLGVLELLAIGLGLVATPTPGALAAAAGPSSFVGVTLAVVFATLLPRTARGRFVRGVTAAVAAGFAVARIAVLVWLLLSGSAARALDLPMGLGAIVGVVLGLALATWAAIEFVGAHPPAPAPASKPLHQTPSATTPTPAPTPAPIPSPAAPQPAANPQWHRGSTPWPRAVEEDPEGTLIRPPRRS